jgi:hypothetical protein
MVTRLAARDSLPFAAELCGRASGVSWVDADSRSDVEEVER